MNINFIGRELGDHPSPAGKAIYRSTSNPDEQPTDFILISADSSTPETGGQAPAHVIGSSVYELFPANDAAFLSSQLAVVLKYDRPVQFELAYTQPGTDLTVRYVVRAARQDECIQLTYRKEPEANSTGKMIDHPPHILKQVLDNMQAGLVLARPIRDEHHRIIDFQFVLTNDYNARITGRTVDEMTGARINDLFPGWQGSELFRYYTEAVETNQTKRITFAYDEFGMKGWFDGTFSCVEGCIMYTYSDVTPLKEAEMAQQQQAALLEQVMNTTPASIVVHQSIRNEAGEIIDFRMTQLNQVAADLLQSSINKVQFRRISTYFPGLADTPLFRAYKQVVKTGTSTRMDVPWGDRWFDFSVARFGDGIVVAVQDSTAVRTYRQQLEQTNLDLKRSNENLESFAYIASHDLQEPLRKLTSFANLLHTQYAGQFNTDVTDIIRRMNASAIRMRLLIQDVLAYARIGKQQEQARAVDLTQLFNELAAEELWSSMYQSKAILTIGELPTVLAEPTQMRQLFQNILANAVKFCPKGTTPTITITSRIIASEALPAGSSSDRRTAGQKPPIAYFHEISVHDNGIGFDQKYTDRIFQIFQQLNGRNRYEGSGIGLAICQKIVEKHDGAITASSKSGEGSTFRVYLPVRSLT
ncbi:ATP-binding protein [Fibrella sp. ES10-3-2-2]|nr:hypothetical protein A6C57_19920 [Fibrella sp. ES10-3-2-2]